MKYIQVRVFEASKVSKMFPDTKPTLDDLSNMFCHPDRYRYIDCYTNSEGEVRAIGAEGWWKFENGRCNNFLDLGPAEIIKEYSEDVEVSRLGLDAFEPVHSKGDALSSGNRGDHQATPAAAGR